MSERDSKPATPGDPVEQTAPAVPRSARQIQAEERLAANLRANLQRRKAQARARAASGEDRAKPRRDGGAD